ncbi:MAG TPA: NADH-quinone oxidoreductase subunit F, partial [Candidatus Binatia bacterium]|nr:NADH-quinone oxidoreductase subunit F [Candidatus Binatia bacterium]
MFQKVLLHYRGVPAGLVSIDKYIADGGYKTARRVLSEMTPDAVVATVKDSVLRGRGGAGFPTGLKWSFVAKNTGKPIYLLCNADESEPGTFKDRDIIENDPHQLLEGIMISAFAIGCIDAYVYIRGEFGYGAEVLKTAIAEAYAQGFLGADAFGTGKPLHIHLHRGAGAYIC